MVIQDHWSVRSDHLGTRTRVNVHHDPVQGRGMSEGKCGKGKGEIGVREGKEGGREVSGRERTKREGRHRR